MYRVKQTKVEIVFKLKSSTDKSLSMVSITMKIFILNKHFALLIKEKSRF